jgi:hypothetical protein
MPTVGVAAVDVAAGVRAGSDVAPFPHAVSSAAAANSASVASGVIFLIMILLE